MQDEIRDKSVCFVIKVGKIGGKLTLALLKLAMRRYLNSRQQGIKPGKVSVRQLTGKGENIAHIEIANSNIKSFDPIAKKYGIHYSLQKDAKKGVYFVLFRTGQAKNLDAAFREFTAKTLNRQSQKKSVRRQLSHFKALAKSITPDRARDREQGAR